MFFGAIKNFAPSWFASVMGTGVVAITSCFYSQKFFFLNYLATATWILNLVLFVLLVIPWILRFCLFREEAISDLSEPVTGQFYATMPIGCLVLAADFLIIGLNHLNTPSVIGLAKGFWILGVVIALLFAVIVPLKNFINPDVKIENLNPAWFMPPVSLIVIPIPGAQLIPYWPDSWQQTMLIFNYISWGSGFFLFLLLEAICLYRFICYPPLPGKIAPTAWINLGPVGAGTIALLNLGSASVPFFGEDIYSMFNILGIFLWGFGFWWLICALCLTAYYFMQNNLPFTLSWWAFTFPLGAYTAATYLISNFLKSPVINTYGFLCYLLLLVFWLVVITRTVVGIARKEFFKDKKISGRPSTQQN